MKSFSVNANHSKNSLLKKFTHENGQIPVLGPAVCTCQHLGMSHFFNCGMRMRCGDWGSEARRFCKIEYPAHSSITSKQHQLLMTLH